MKIWRENLHSTRESLYGNQYSSQIYGLPIELKVGSIAM